MIYVDVETWEEDWGEEEDIEEGEATWMDLGGPDDDEEEDEGDA